MRPAQSRNIALQSGTMPAQTTTLPATDTDSGIDISEIMNMMIMLMMVMMMMKMMTGAMSNMEV